MTDEAPRLPESSFPGLIPTMNNTGFMTEKLDAYSQQFAAEAGALADEVRGIGCAYGIATLAALQAGARVCAADIEAKHLAVLEGRVPPALRLRLRTQVAKMPDTDFPDQAFGAILAARVLHFLTGEEIERVVAKMHRWLQPGGKVFLIADSPYVGPWYKAAPEYEARRTARRGLARISGQLCAIPPGRHRPDAAPEGYRPPRPRHLAARGCGAGFESRRRHSARHDAEQSGQHSRGCDRQESPRTAAVNPPGLREIYTRARRSRS